MTVKIKEITEEERTYIDELKDRMKGVVNEEMYDDDHMFKRYVRARNYNIDAAELMLRKHLNWRKANQVDTILQDFVMRDPEGVRYLAINDIGFDKEGSPVIYNPFGSLDLKGILKSVTKHEIHQYMIFHFEHGISLMKQQSEKLGRVIDTFVYIFNFENFSIFNATHKPTLELLASFVTMYDTNYPERLKACIAINASFSFTLYWAVIKPFLTGSTFQKVKVFGKEGWKEELLNIMHADDLPAFLGGNKTDPDGNPLCNTFIYHGEKVPEKFFLNRKSMAITLSNGKRLVIPRRSRAEVKLEVLYAGSTIEYEFETRTRDIGFSLLYKESKNSEPQELLPNQRMETGVATESRMFRCDKPGIYVLEFDNSYSWWHQKEVYYRATVVLPHNSSRRDSSSAHVH